MVRIVGAVFCLCVAGLSAGACLIAAGTDDNGPSAWDLYEQGRAAEKAGHIAQAYIYYAEAAAADPKNRIYWQRSQALRTRAALEGLVMPQASASTATGAAESPAAKTQNDTDAADSADAPEPEYFKPEPATARDLWDAARLAPPPQLRPDDGTGDIDLRGDARQLWEGLAKIFGLQCVFDPDYQPGKEIRFHLHAVDYQVAMNGLQAVTGSFIIPLSDKVFMVAKDTQQKRTELQPRVSMAVPLPDNVTQQDFNQAVTAVQQAVGIDRIAFDTQTKTVILRDTLAKVTAARALLRDLVRPPAQIAVQLKLMEVTRNDMLTYGIEFPNLFSLNFLTNWFKNQLTPPAGIQGLLSFGGGKTLMGLGIVTPSFVAQMSKATSSNLLESELRTMDGVAASMHIGEQYPVLTSQYVGPASFTQSGTAYTPPPSFQFVDLGLTLKVTASVRSMDSALLDIDAEYKVLTGNAVNGIPVIGNRSFKSNVQLQIGQWAVISGLLDVNQARSIAGVAGLSRIPGLGPLTDMRTKTSNTDQVLLLMRPVALSVPPADLNPGRTYRMGTETRPFTLM
jgi:type II secretory pathway component GspD/PulD (secretin)